MENIKQLAMRVQELRAQKNFTVPQMAELLGVTPEEYQSYEDGSKQAPFSFYYNLAEHFGLDVSSADLYGLERFFRFTADFAVQDEPAPAGEF